jgi:hypothetical protein
MNEEKSKSPLFARVVRHNKVKTSEKASLVISDLFTTCELLRREKHELQGKDSKTVLFFD